MHQKGTCLIVPIIIQKIANASLHSKNPLSCSLMSSRLAMRHVSVKWVWSECRKSAGIGAQWLRVCEVVWSHSKSFEGIRRQAKQFELCSEGSYKFVKAWGCMGVMSKGVPELQVWSGPISINSLPHCCCLSIVIIASPAGMLSPADGVIPPSVLIPPPVCHPTLVCHPMLVYCPALVSSPCCWCVIAIAVQKQDTLQADAHSNG